MSTLNPSITTALGLLDREAMERVREAVVARDLDFAAATPQGRALQRHV